jgi:hypothetical protein
MWETRPGDSSPEPVQTTDPVGVERTGRMSGVPATFSSLRSRSRAANTVFPSTVMVPVRRFLPNWSRRSFIFQPGARISRGRIIPSGSQPFRTEAMALSSITAARSTPFSLSGDDHPLTSPRTEASPRRTCCFRKWEPTLVKVSPRSVNS